MTATRSSSVRLKNVSNYRRDPVETLQIGIFVIYFYPKEKVFVNRILKVDTQSRFLFLLQDTEPNALQIGNTRKDPFAVRLSEVSEVLTSLTALRLIESLGIQDDLVTEATANIILYCGASRDKIDFDKAIIILAPPSQRLKEVLDCVLESAKQSSGAHDADAELEAIKEHARYVDQVRIKKLPLAFTEDATHIELEFTVRSEEAFEEAESDKKFLTYALEVPLEPVNTKKEVARLMEQMGVLPHLDQARMALVIYDMALHRQWTSGHHGVFGNSIWDYMQDHELTTSNFDLTPADREKLFAVPSKTHRCPDTRIYGSRGLKSSLIALRHAFDLDHLIHDADLGRVRMPTDLRQVIIEKRASAAAAGNRASESRKPGRKPSSLGQQDQKDHKETRADSKRATSTYRPSENEPDSPRGEPSNDITSKELQAAEKTADEDEDYQLPREETAGNEDRRRAQRPFWEVPTGPLSPMAEEDIGVSDAVPEENHTYIPIGRQASDLDTDDVGDIQEI